MNLIIEGPDNSGKSYLAKIIQQQLAWQIKSTEGPEKYPGEINERVTRYLSLDRRIFDRHPCVSQPIYGKFRGGDPVDSGLMAAFYSIENLMVYCIAPEGRGLEGQVLKDYDTPDHQHSVEENAPKIRALYDAWAYKHAMVYYRWTDSPFVVANLVSTYLNYGVSKV